jgi:S1-C subfamily serine protease
VCSSDLTALLFQEAGPKTLESRGYRGKISLGIMPDVSAEGKNGLAVLAVIKGKPAADGGIKRGDVIIAIDRKTVGDIYEYMYRLEQLKVGDTVLVRVKRGEEIIDLKIQL